MANELIHASAGTTLTQSEFEAIGLHVCNSQATGDLIYASSSSQLSRLGIGAADTVLTCNGTVPSWSATPILNTAVAKGTWTASGTWTIPAVTLGGAISAGGYNIDGIGTILAFASSSANPVILSRSISTPLIIRSYLTAANTGTALILGTRSGTDTEITRVAISGGINTALVTWASCTHTGLVLGGNMTVTGYGFVGPIYTTNSYLQVTEMAAPGAGAANTARIYALEGAGDALTDLCAVFQDGTVDVFAQESTPLDSPIFAEPSQTEVKVKVIKPHPGLIQFVAEYDTGKRFVLRELQYHDAEKIVANIGCEKSLPTDWEVTTAEERLAKVELNKLEN